MDNSTVKTRESVSYSIYYTHILLKEQVPQSGKKRVFLFKNGKNKNKNKKTLILNDNLVSIFEVTYKCPRFCVIVLEKYLLI